MFQHTQGDLVLDLLLRISGYPTDFRIELTRDMSYLLTYYRRITVGGAEI